MYSRRRENKELIDVIPACIPNESNPEDVEEFSGDDPYDALRMVSKRLIVTLILLLIVVLS
jgi:hypothetical protein